MQILIADDDNGCRNTLAQLLSDDGHTVTAVADGAEALAMLSGAVGAEAAVAIDLVITDCQMPRLDGIALTRALRSAGRRIPVIMLSGQSDPAVISIALSAGVDRYLTKPLRPAILHEAIASLILSAAHTASLASATTFRQPFAA